MIKYPYIIIDDNPDHALETRAMTANFAMLSFAGSADNYDEGIDLILEINPKLIFLEINPENKESNLSLALINELYRYLKVMPQFIITTKGKDLAFDAIRHDVSDYLLKPLRLPDFRKALLKFEKRNQPLHDESIGTQETFSQIEIEKEEKFELPEEDYTPSEEIILSLVEPIDPPLTIPSDHQYIEDKPLIICVKSYGDYRFINANDICYLQADNNSTDIHLNNGEMITAFKTLKHFETVLNSPFVRIHNSYIVNIDYVSRIHTGNAVCYIKNTITKLPFSKSYKDNIDAILNSITKGNYLEI